MLIHKPKQTIYIKLKKKTKNKTEEYYVHEAFSSVVSGVCFEFKSLDNFEYYEAVEFIQSIKTTDVSLGYKQILDFVKKHLVEIHNKKVDIEHYSFDVLFNLYSALLAESTISEDEESFL